MSTIKEIELFLINNNVKTSAKEFVEITSNIYHKLESEIYDICHYSIELSIPHWQKILNNLETYGKKDLNILDFGCGTGFVTNQIIKSSFFNEEINITCYDLSPDMIQVCKNKFSKCGRINYLSDKEGFEILKSKIGKFDIIMCNSLLHHILDHKELFRTFDDSLVDNGIVIIGHEPNKNFYRNIILQKVSFLFRIQKKIVNKIKKVYHNNNNASTDLSLLTYKELLNKKLIDTNFPKNLIQKLIDIHVPMNTFDKQPWGELGFDVEFFKRATKNKFIVQEQVSYNHIKDQQAYKFFLWRNVSKVLEKIFPNDGADVIFVLKKS